MAYQPKSYRKFLATSVATALVATTVAPAAIGATGFTDLDSVKSWEGAEEAIAYLVEKGAIQGPGDGTFNPKGDLSRAAAAEILAKALDLDLDNDGETGFTDVPADHWGAKAIKALKEEGIVDGVGDGTNFNPSGTLTRAALAKMVVKAYGLERDENAILSFSDVDESAWYADDILTLASLGILQGSGNKLNPTDKVSRAAAAIFVHRAEVEDVRVPVEKDVVELVSVNPVNAKTLEVKFNTAVDTEKAEIEVKRGTVKPSVKEIKFAEDKKSATIEFNANMVAGDYTVTVTGLTEEALTGSVKVEAEKLTEIEFLSDVAVISGNNVKVNVQAKNQYGETVNDKLTTANVTASKGTTGHSINKDGVLTVNGNSGDFKVDEKVVVTIVDSTTGVTATKTLTIAQAAAVESIELGEITTDDEQLAKKPLNVTNMDTDFAKYYIPVTIKDQYGNTLKAEDLAGVNVLSSNEKIVKLKSGAGTEPFKNTKEGTVIELAKPTATATHGTAVITVVSAGTGKTANVTVEVLENAKTDVLTLSAPEETLKQDVKTELPFSAADQYGNELVSNTDLALNVNDTTTTKLVFTDGSSITATGAELDYSVDYGNKNKVKLSVTPKAKNVVLTAVSATGKAQTLNLTAEEAPIASTLGGLSKDIYTAIQKGEEQTINITDVIVKDQYGEEILLTSDYKLEFEAADETFDVVALTATELQVGQTTSTKASAALKGTEEIKISLLDATDGDKVLDTISVTFETVELKDISTFGIKEIGKLYSGTSFKYGNDTADYDKEVEIFGKKGSTDVLVDQDLLVSTTITTPLVVDGPDIVQLRNQNATNGADKTATLTGVIAGADNPIIVTQTVTYSDAQSVITDLKVRKTSGSKVEITDGAVVVPAAQVVSNKKIGPVGADSTFQFYAVDQYGVVAKELSYTVTNLKSATATKVEVDKDGIINVTGSALAAGDTFTITAIVDGVVKSIKVIVGE